MNEVVSGTAKAGLSRRTLVAGAAWSVPAIALASATPAAAASADIQWNLYPTSDWIGVVNRCDRLAAGAIEFWLTADGAVPETEQDVTIELSQGISFMGAVAGQEQVQTFRTVGGRVQLPVIYATGSVGYYTATATAKGLTSVVFLGIVGSAPGTVYAFETGDSALNLQERTDLPRATTGTAGRQSWAIVGEDGRVYYWGAAFGSGTRIASVPGTAVKVDTWGERTNAWYGGLLIQTADNRVWYGTARESDLPFHEVTGFRGVVRDVACVDGAIYVLTDEGLFYGGTAIEGSNNEAPLWGPMTGSVGASQLTVWGQRQGSVMYTGGAFVQVNGEVRDFWSSEHDAMTPNTAKGTPNPAKELFAHDGGMVVLGEDGGAYGMGKAFRSTTWVFIARNVVDLASWGVHYGADFFSGGLALIADGSLVEFMSASNGSGTQSSIISSPSDSINKVFAADGIYQIFDSEGNVYGWKGNPDGTIAPPAKLPIPPLTDLFHHGLHVDNGFYGFGLGITAEACSL